MNMSTENVETARSLRDGKSILDVVREYFPDAPEGEVDHIIWGRTGYPVFWQGDPETSFRRSLRRHMKARQRGYKVFCDFCNEQATSGGWLCRCCKKTWRRITLGLGDPTSAESASP